MADCSQIVQSIQAVRFSLSNESVYSSCVRVLPVKWQQILLSERGKV
ncbi:MAG: hypothetical protein RLZZ458_1626 [Planctomycetota bacterium]